MAPALPQGLRLRRRADGSHRCWWEPSARARKLGFEPRELDADRLSWSAAEADKINRAYADALAGKAPARASGTRDINMLIADYRRSLAWSQLADMTRRSYDRLFHLIARKWGREPLAGFTKPVLVTWYETLYREAGPTQALNLIRAMSLLFSHAERRGWKPEGTNPCFRLKMKTPPPRNMSIGWAGLDAIVAAAAAEGLAPVGLAARLSMLTGQRQTDVLAIRADGIVIAADGRLAWTLVRSKRGNAAMIPLHDELAADVAAAVTAALDAGRQALLVDPAVGRPYDHYLFQKRWQRVRARAVADGHGYLAALQFRDLRRSFGVLARSGGASRDDVGHVLGNSAATNPRLDRTYMPPVEATVTRAVRAIRRPGEKEQEGKDP